MVKSPLSYCWLYGQSLLSYKTCVMLCFVVSLRDNGILVELSWPQNCCVQLWLAHKETGSNSDRFRLYILFIFFVDSKL